MRTIEVIQSTKNEKIKEIRSLSDKKARMLSRSFIVEGYNIIKDMPSYARAQKLVIKESQQEKCLPLTEKFDVPVYVVKDFVFDSVSETENGSGIIAVLEMEEAKELSGDLVLVADGISDAGNMGTIIRTAVAMGVTDIVGIDSVDFYNSKTVRSTMGGIFHANLVSTNRENAKKLLSGYKVASLDMSGEDIFGYKPVGKTAIVVGSEAHGVSKEMRSISDVILSIPMPSGKIESLNASVSAGIAVTALSHNAKTI